VRTARRSGCPEAYRIDNAGDIPVGDDGAPLPGARVVGVTAGASAAESIVREVVARLDAGVVVHERVTDEDEYFPMPRELRELIRALATVVGFSLGSLDAARGVDTSDRNVEAAEVLAAIAAH
jgi:4-hydroxy-3-methylbut-2-enyl diphosphate reductase